MFEKSQGLTNGMIVFSVLVSDYEKLDFKNDALAGVRANYFNSGRAPQHEVTEIVVDDMNYRLSYSMENGKPLSWKAARSGLPYQSVKRGDDELYCVITYGSRGTVCKRQFFDKEHLWLRTEYYDREITGRVLSKIYPRTVCGITALVLENFEINGKTSLKTLFPSDKKPQKLSARALVYSSSGMLWYDESFAPTDLPFAAFERSAAGSDKGRFKFSVSREANGAEKAKPIDLDACGYLTDEDVASIQNDRNDRSAPVPESREATYSAYEVIEKILSEAHKGNENLFGELQTLKNDVSKTAAENTPADTSSPEKTAAESKEPASNTERAFTGAHFRKEDTESFGSGKADSETEAETVSSDGERCNMVVLTKSGRYVYYGALDKNNCRTGRGRTVSPEGFTSYDGEYKDDMRSGFGVCYYKNGSINYAGDWSENTRSGRGVGYRLSDGTMHAGGWLDNSPEGVGARFDGSGNFIDVCSYSGGVRSGKSVSFDKDGNVVVAVYENGEKISEHVIDDEVLKSI